MEIEVRSRVPGAAGADLPTVLVELPAERVTTRELIRCAVAEQLKQLRADSARCRRMLDRQYLSDDEIRRQAARGAVRLPSLAVSEPDEAAETARCYRAFAKGVFAVFAGGRQATSLDDVIELGPGQHVLFLRLVPLAGG